MAVQELINRLEVVNPDSKVKVFDLSAGDFVEANSLKVEESSIIIDFAEEEHPEK